MLCFTGCCCSRDGGHFTTKRASDSLICDSPMLATGRAFVGKSVECLGCNRGWVVIDRSWVMSLGERKGRKTGWNE